MTIKPRYKVFVCSITDGKYEIDPALCVRRLGEWPWFACLIPNSVMQLFIIFIISIRCIKEYRI